MPNDASLSDVCAAIRNNNSFLVTAHVSPDSDAVGSSAAMVLLLRSLGKRADWYLADPVPLNIRELTPIVPFGSFLEITEAAASEQNIREVTCGGYDVLLVLDTATRERAGSEIDSLAGFAKVLVTIDHHISNPGWGDLNFIDSSSAASAEIVLSLARLLGANLSRLEANLLYAGILDDTGCFRYSNTSAKVLESAAFLVSSGAQPDLVANTLHFSVEEKVLRLRAEAMRNLETFYEGKFATIYTTLELLKEFNCSAENTETLVDIARSVRGVQACAFFREAESNWKISWRSKNPAIDVNLVAGRFGGGGHSAAAGCRMVGDFASVRKTVIETMAAFFPS